MVWVDFFFFFIPLLDWRELGEEGESNEGERGERKKYLNNQIENYYNRVNIHDFTITILYVYNVIDGLMWVVFEQKCVKLTTFSIL